MFQKSLNNERLFLTIKDYSSIIKKKEMKLTSERGREIREEYTNVKEKEICDNRGLVQIGGNRNKIDGSDGTSNASIKNFSGSSSQVHLTTQNRFINVLGLNDESIQFVKMFCGDSSLNINGKDRYNINEIPSDITKSFMLFLNDNKNEVIDLIVRNGFNVNTIVYRNLKTNETYEITYDEVLNKINKCTWVSKKGGIHLKDVNGKTYFHFQREGKKNKNNRYNVLWHIHRNLFLID
jgi:hypothetical protein